MADSPHSLSVVSWLKKSLCIPTKFSFSPSTSPPYHPAFAKLLSIKSREDPVESIELSLALGLVEKATQTEQNTVKESQEDTPKLFSMRAREILASRVPTNSSPNNFNRFDIRYKSDIVRGSFSTPRKSLPSPSFKNETPKSSLADPDDFVKGIQSNEDFYFDDDFSCPELPVNLKLISKFDDQLDMSTFNGFENLFDKSVLDGLDLLDKTSDMSITNEKDEILKRRDSVGAFKEYLQIVFDDLV